MTLTQLDHFIMVLVLGFPILGHNKTEHWPAKVDYDSKRSYSAPQPGLGYGLIYTCST